MNKINITKITFISIDCIYCKNQYRVYCDSEWDDIKEMKISTDKRLMFCCPYCDNISIEETDYTSICKDKDEEKMVWEVMKQWQKLQSNEVFEHIVKKISDTDIAKDSSDYVKSMIKQNRKDFVYEKTVGDIYRQYTAKGEWFAWDNGRKEES